ncbi:MAG: L-threonylcarbamoyladenylate synthase [Desulfobulbaceae bacterium]|nr:L-threonylcarbamoyladenylate synthase [Desulfobulbaceae bacterium]
MTNASISSGLSQDLQQALLVLKQGGVVAFPTETYYGLAVDPFNCQAVERLFRLKRRSAIKPILVLIDDQVRLSSLVAEIPPQFHPLMDRFWPGPLTLIFPAKAGISPSLTADTGTVGVRISSHPVAAHLCALAGGAITATSANLSGRMPAASEFEVLAQFGSRLDWLVKAGPTSGGAASTIVATDGSGLGLVRAGVIQFSKIESVTAKK